jgi:hypothetical protein
LSLPVFRAPPVRSVEATVQIENRVLKRIAVKLKHLDLDIGEGFFLESIDVAIAPSPLAVAGGVGATFGPGEAPLLNLSGKLSYSRTPERWIASGTVALARDLAGFLKPKLASAVVTVNPGRAIEVTGKTAFTVHGWGLSASTDGFVSPDAFNFEGKAKLSLPGPDLHGDALISSVGLAGCFGIKLLLASVHIGFGYRWGGSLSFMHSSCDVGPWRAVVHPLTATRQVQQQTQPNILVPAGLKFEVFSATGGNIRIVGPDGTVYTTTRNVNTTDLYVTHDQTTHTAYLIIPDPPPGPYEIETLAKQPITVRAADSIPQPIINGSVTGTGTTRTLDYSVDLFGVPGETVAFFESTSATIPGATPVTSTDASGSNSANFAPEALGPVQRYIWAVVSVDGLIREATLVTAFDFAPIPPLPPPVATISVSSSGATVIWKPLRPAAAWEILIDEASGARTLRTLPGKTQLLRIPNQTGSKTPLLQTELTPIDQWGRLGTPVLCDSAKPGRCLPIPRLR